MAVMPEIELPVYLRVGDGEECNIGSITVTPVMDGTGTLTAPVPDVVAFLHEAADECARAQAGPERASGP
ncbi:hypothetical protein ABZ069_23145 [Streptomyces microflavus]|uniref:hypothetical protein n=1 Tax=Streptomyces microflavus TaxID=1919 RepID=UPI0033B1D11C